ncbi:MAG: FAD-dependent oxidoreductase [Rhodoferax sp.]|nr:FAD-dependent oxidoreductase [Rhodoferax sp.]
MRKPVVIVGAGHAGFHCAAALRQQSYEDGIVLIAGEDSLPYQRPPLSKAYLLQKTSAADLLFRPERFFGDQRIDVVFANAASIDRRLQQVVLLNGDCVEYSHLVLATGAKARRLAIPGADLAGVLALQTLGDADTLLPMLRSCENVLVVGAGFIGLEFATAARGLGLKVRVVDVADRPMSRALSNECGGFFANAHRQLGTEFLFNTGLERLEGLDGKVVAAVTSQGRRLPADLVLVGIGATPQTQLALQAGLAVENGISVDSHLLTADPNISAIGDVACFPEAGSGRAIRLESVQNATDQGRAVAARIMGKEAAYATVPWFWSDQGDIKLQIAGLRRGDEEHVVIGDPASRSFSVLCIRDDTLAAVESVNRPADHMLARRLIAKGCRTTPAAARQPAFDLKAL